MKAKKISPRRWNPLALAVIPAFIYTFAFTGCGEKHSAKSASMATQNAYSENFMMDAEEIEVYSDMANFGNRSSTKGTKEVSSTDRKLIRRGNISLEVQSLADTRAAVEETVKAYGGYIESSEEYSSWIHLTVRIPAERFDEALSTTGSLGKIRQKSVSSEDVTEQYYDIEARISARKALLERLEQHLKETKDMKEILEVEDKLNSVTTELEIAEGQMKRLSSQITYSTLSIDASLPQNQTEEGFILPDTGADFREFLGNTVSFLSHLLIAILYIAAFGIPLVLLAALLWWLCFGKIGLVKKLFAKVSGNKKE